MATVTPYTPAPYDPTKVGSSTQGPPPPAPVSGSTSTYGYGSTTTTPYTAPPPPKPTTTPPPPPPPTVSVPPPQPYTPFTYTPGTYGYSPETYSAMQQGAITDIQRQTEQAIQDELGALNARGLIRGGISGPGLESMGNIAYDSTAAMASALANLQAQQEALMFEQQQADYANQLAAYNAQTGAYDTYYGNELAAAGLQGDLYGNQLDYSSTMAGINAQNYGNEVSAYNAGQQAQQDALEMQMLQMELEAMKAQQPTTSTYYPAPRPTYYPAPTPMKTSLTSTGYAPTY